MTGTGTVTGIVMIGVHATRVTAGSKTVETEATATVQGTRVTLASRNSPAPAGTRRDENCSAVLLSPTLSPYFPPSLPHCLLSLVLHVLYVPDYSRKAGKKWDPEWGYV